MKIIRRKRKKLLRIKKRGRRRIFKNRVILAFYKRYLAKRRYLVKRRYIIKTKVGRNRYKWKYIYRYEWKRKRTPLVFFRIKHFLRRRKTVTRIVKVANFRVLRNPTPFLEFRRFKQMRVVGSLRNKIWNRRRKRGRSQVDYKKQRLLIRVRGHQLRLFKRPKSGRLRLRMYLRLLRPKKRHRFTRKLLQKNRWFRPISFQRRARTLLRTLRKAYKIPRKVKQGAANVYIGNLALKFIRNQMPYRLVEKRDILSRSHFVWRFNNLLMRHGSRHHSARALVHVHYHAKCFVGLNLWGDWLDMQARLRFPFLLKSYYYRGARGVRLVKYVLAKERVDRQYIRSFRFLRAAVFRNQNTAFWLKVFNEYEDLILGERSPLLTGLEQLTVHAIEARGDRLDDKYHRALERLENDPELHFRW